MKLDIIQIFLLFAQHPTKGRFLISNIGINYGIIGAALLEMAINKQMKIENQRLILMEKGETSHPIIADIIVEVNKSKKSRRIRDWMNRLTKKSRKYERIVLDELQDRQLIRIVPKKFLGVIPYRKNYLEKQGALIRNSLIAQLRDNLLLQQKLNEESVAMLGLIHACQMHKVLTKDKKERKIIRKALKKIVKENPVADALDQTIRQTQSAVMAGVIASTAVSTS